MPELHIVHKRNPRSYGSSEIAYRVHHMKPGEMRFTSAIDL